MRGGRRCTGWDVLGHRVCDERLVDLGIGNYRWLTGGRAVPIERRTLKAPVRRGAHQGCDPGQGSSQRIRLVECAGGGRANGRRQWWIEVG
ncbi:pollen-specific leucine-rich repeat extensin-like protein 3 [Iris pallida]|uniref:Pollen-specific leucine-rich repeat extensin-like protein 3 n=1 Tax=Iris pallida TaxID=29817 RepID=A0AAX6FWY2_IRIPA|nr:pollen-specific leucine-rich repeat extensin-like protein 3 [Iris pallida]KAJ6845599.1 pollen-specific leucine-rich repeat extensin-like protein 3 [Iris pallida]